MKNIYILLAAAIVALTGCVKDKLPHEMPQPVANDGSVSLSIALPAPVAKNLNRRTRAVGDFDSFENVNILMTDGNSIIRSLYLELDNAGENTTALPADVEYDVRGENYDIHFDKEWFQHYDISSEDVSFYLVGNYGEAIDVATVEDLQELKYEIGSTAQNVLYGSSEDYDEADGHNHGTVGNLHNDYRALKVDLKRLTAMVTIQIDGTMLAQNVEIIPLSISLHEVPAWSYIGQENKIYLDGDSEWIEDGEAIDVRALWGSVGNYSGESMVGNEINSIVGAHYTDVEVGGTVGAPNYDAGMQEVPALFLLENIHGEGFGATDVEATTGKGKRPAGVANDETAIWNAARTMHCSYLEVKANYLEYKDDGTVNRGGEITYRVFLGGNLTDDFNVERNSYYRYTLKLSGTGIGEGDASWRLDDETSYESVLDESDFILNGAGEMIVIDELVAKPNNSGWEIVYQQGASQRDANGNNPYIYWVLDEGWEVFPLDNDPTFFSNSQKLESFTADGNMQFRLFLDPMSAEDGDGYMRKVVFTLGYQNDGYVTADWITVTQYAPMVINVDPADTSPEIKAQIAAAGKNPQLPLTIYFDRVDRRAEPWGFAGQAIANAGSGTQNGVALLGNAMADDYLPFGEGSAMMQAAYINYYQWMTGDPVGFTDTGLTNPNFVEIASAAGDNPTDPIVPNSIPSSEEWKLLVMLQEAAFGVFDSRHNIIPWQSYWTSDAVEDDDTQSWAYNNMGGNFVEMPRGTALPYRMVYIAQ
jgi:hypothetical protein